jgi:SAM-dependent methyltransferase
MMILNNDVTTFLRSIDLAFKYRLVNEIDPARLISLIQFDKFMSNWHKPIESIAIVSGQLTEPELRLIRGYRDVTLLEFDEDPNLFDLNKDWSLPEWSSYHNAFDLVLCEQVLEHVINPQRAVQNLAQLIKPGGLLHITVPAINNSHGEPFYFYGGFPAATLEQFSRIAGLNVAECGSWISDKGARMYATCDWAPISQSGSIRQMFQGLWLSRKSTRAFLRIVLGRMRSFARYPFQKLVHLHSGKNAVTTWLFAEKPTKPE